MKTSVRAVLLLLVLPFTTATLPTYAAPIGVMSSEIPTRAAAFVNSIGINTHFDQAPYYGPNYPVVAKLLVDSGIKHIRGSVIARPNYIARLKELAQSGIRTTLITRPQLKDKRIVSYPGMISPSMEAYEGPNEPDRGTDPGWPATIRTFMQRLYNDVKGNPDTARYPIVAPSLTGRHDLLGDISQYVDYGNMHNYLSTFNPGTRGWGSRTAAGIYGSLSYNENLVKAVSGSKPVESTETGFGSKPGGGPRTLDYVTDGKYIPRLYFVQYNAGVVRTFVYELLDKDRSGKLYTNFGLIDADLKPKPAYNAVKAVIADIADVPTPFTPKALSYEISGNYRNVQHTLLQKANGAYYLALWLEVPSWKNGQPIAVPSQSVSIKTAQAMSSVSVLRLGDDGTPSTSVLHQDAGHSVSLPVTDSVSIVKLTP